VYDFGDGWLHEILVERAVHDPDVVSSVVCLAGARACPPEDCGGIGGYARFLAAIADPADEQHDELREWIGGDFDPEHFDLAAVNRALARGRPRPPKA
jgi:hypothetical protein